MHKRKINRASGMIVPGKEKLRCVPRRSAGPNRPSGSKQRSLILLRARPIGPRPAPSTKKFGLKRRSPSIPKSAARIPPLGGGNRPRSNRYPENYPRIAEKRRKLRAGKKVTSKKPANSGQFRHPKAVGRSRAARLGLEPRITESESVVLPITLSGSGCFGSDDGFCHLPKARNLLVKNRLPRRSRQATVGKV